MSEAENKKAPTTRARAAPNRKRRRVIIKWVKRGVLGVIALAMLVGAVFAFLPKPVPAEVAVVERGPLVVTVDEDGRTQVKDRYIVSAPLAGNIPRLGWRPGDAVAESTVLVRIVPAAPPLLDARTRAEAEARLAAALAGQRQTEAQLSRARTAHEQAQTDLARQKSLADKGARAPAVAEQAEFAARARAEELRSAGFGVKVAAQEVASARAALGVLQRGKGAEEPSMELAAPTSGKVLRVIRQDEGLVAAGAPLLELGDPESLEIVVDVLTRDAVHIAPGARVTIGQWGGSASLEGRVHRVEPSAFTRVSALGVEEQRVNVIINIETPHAEWESLGDGFRVEASIVVWEEADVVSVPGSAVFRRGDDWAVYVVKDGTAALTSVEVGRRNQRRVQITSGLAAGDRVVLHPSDRITDGTELELP